jgi:tRNA threonylcarbamoyl adenosine modification protein YjeE
VSDSGRVRVGRPLLEAELVDVAARWARAWGRALHHGETRVLGLVGDLGAGKTTFIRAFVRALTGGADQEVTSPTYALVHVYETRPPVRHLDLYRVGGLEELEDLGFEELIAAPGLILIEWFERCKDAAPADRVELKLDIEDADRRRLTAIGHGRGREWMEKIE